MVDLDVADVAFGLEHSRAWVMVNVERGVRWPMHGYLRAASAAGWRDAVICIGDEYVPGLNPAAERPFLVARRIAPTGRSILRTSSPRY